MPENKNYPQEICKVLVIFVGHSNISMRPKSHYYIMIFTEYTLNFKGWDAFVRKRALVSVSFAFNIYFFESKSKPHYSSLKPFSDHPQNYIYLVYECYVDVHSTNFAFVGSNVWDVYCSRESE